MFEYFIIHHPSIVLTAWITGKCLAFLLLHLALVITRTITKGESR